MPELPEVETVVRTLQPHLPGRVIAAAEFHSRFVTPGDRALLAAQVVGSVIRGVARHGKFIVVELDRGVLVIHLGMTGRLLLDAPPTKHSYGVFHLDRGTLIYDDPRQFGSIEFGSALPPRVAELGPDSLSIPLEEFLARLWKRNARIKPLLLNQRFVRGLGNIYADEALFRARIHPRALSGRLGRKRASALHLAISETLQQAIAHRGSSISDYMDAAGERGSFQTMHQVYGKQGQPCPECGSSIRRILVAQRGTHYCPRCQRP